MKKLPLTALMLFSLTSLKAQSFLAPNNVREFNSYTPSVDVRLYERVITEKQRTYDYNVEQIRELLKDKEYYLYELRKVDYESFNYWNKSFNEHWSKVSNARPDFSNNDTYNAVKYNINWFITQIKNSIRDVQ